MSQSVSTNSSALFYIFLHFFLFFFLLDVQKQAELRRVSLFCFYNNNSARAMSNARDFSNSFPAKSQVNEAMGISKEFMNNL